MTQSETLEQQREMKLLVRARVLDEDALAEVHQIYYGPIFRYIAFRVSPEQLAEDLTSDVFTRLLTAFRDKTAPQNSLRGWLYTVASRVVTDHYRRAGRRQQVELNEMVESDAAGPDELLEKKLSAETLQSAMETLTDDQQQVLALRFGFGMRIREVAQTIGKSEGAVKQLQLRALSALSQQMKPGSELL